MNTIILTMGLLVQGLVPVQAQELPGSVFARPAGPLVLRAAPSGEAVGVLMLSEADVLRLGAERGNHREAFVAQGFPVYLHEAFVSIAPVDAGVTVTGDRVNARLLPATEGLLPLGQLPRGSGPLALLDREGDWVRVLAPPELALFVATASVAEIPEAEGRARWNELLVERQLRSLAALERLRSADPEWRRQSKLLAQAESLADVDLAVLDRGMLAARRDEVQRLSEAAVWPETVATLTRLEREFGEALALREDVERSAEEQRARLALEEQQLARESRMLSLGLRYAGRGEPVTASGTVVRQGPEAAPVYVLAVTGGENLKLCAAPDVVTLASLVGQRVDLGGRRLFLATVSGPVLAIDRVTKTGLR